MENNDKNTTSPLDREIVSDRQNASGDTSTDDSVAFASKRRICERASNKDELGEGAVANQRSRTR
jgi:hypothetical protein